MRIFLALLMICAASSACAKELHALAMAGVRHLTLSEESARASRVLKWGTRLGAGARLRWTILKEPQEDQSRRNCRALEPPLRLLRRSGISAEVFRREIQKAAAKWSEIADVTFEYVEESALADVVIAAMAVPLGYAFADISVRPSTVHDTDEITKAVVCLSPIKEWRITGGTESAFSLSRTFGHEIGHVLGLDHPDPSGPIGVMSYRNVPDDVRANAQEREAAVRLYGPPRNAPLD